MTIKYLDAKRIRGSSTADAPLGTDLKVYYKMDDSSTTEIVNVANTITGNSTMGTNANIDLINAPTPSVTGTPTNLGTAYTFNGTDELGKMGDSGDLSQWTFMHNQTASFTFNVWIKFPSGTQPTNNKFLWDDSRFTDTVPSFQIRGKGGFWRVIVSQGSSGGVVMSTDDNPQLDCPQDQEWHMYTFTYDYLNTPNFTYRVDAATSGTYYETKNNSSQNALNTNAPVQPYLFATQNTGGTIGDWQAGTACELAIWDRVLTSAEITRLYNGGDGRVLTLAGVTDEKATLVTAAVTSGDLINSGDLGTSYNMTNTGATINRTTSSKSGFGYSLDFDDNPSSSDPANQFFIKDFTSQSLISGTNGEFCIGGWAKLVDTNGDQEIIDLRTEGTHNYVKIYHWSANQFNALAYINASAYSYIRAGDDTGNDGGWHHFMLERSGSVFTLYIDNVSKATWDNGNAFGNMNQIRIGRWWEGELDELFFLTRKTTSAEKTSMQSGVISGISSMYTDSDLKFYFKCDEYTPPSSNLPEGTIFEQTNDYKYFFLKDNVWEAET